MQVLERKEQLSAIEARPLLVEPLCALQMMEELPSVDEPTFGVSKTPSDDAWRHYIRKYEVQFLLRLEAELKRNNERVVHASEHQALGQRVRNLAALNDVLLANRLQSVDTRRVALPDLHDLRQTDRRQTHMIQTAAALRNTHPTEAAFPNDREQLKAVDCQLAVLRGIGVRDEQTII